MLGSLKKVVKLTTELQDNKLDDRMLQARRETKESIEATVEKIAQAVDAARSEEARLFSAVRSQLENISSA